MADGARRGGCRIHTSTRVTGIEVTGGRVRAVETDGGRIEAETVVNAAGMYAAEIGRLAGVRIPVIPMSHQYVVTQPVRSRADGDDRLPTLRDPDLLVYYREDGDGLVMGGYERHSKPAFMPNGTGGFDRIPPDFNGRLLEDDPDRFEEIAENSKRRVPAMADVAITKLINGPEAFTPDNEFCLGETEVAGLFVAAGFCAHGLAGAGGIGKVMAEWIAEGEPSLDLWHMDVRRFGAQYRSPAYTHARITRDVRDLLRHPLPEPRARGGQAAAGLTGERLAPRAPSRVRREVGMGAGQLVRGERRRRRRVAAPAGMGGQHWSPAIGAEHAATRERAAIFDESSFAKLEITGPGSAAFLERLCDNRVARDVGKITYTQMLNRRGGIECDFTVARLADERFSIVTGTAFGNHDREWIRRHLPGDGSVQVATSPRPGPASGSGGRSRGTSWRRSRHRTSRPGRSRTCRSARSPWATSRYARCG